MMAPQRAYSSDLKRRKFAQLLNFYPIEFKGNPLNLLFLEDTTLIADPKKYIQLLNSPNLYDDTREFCLTATRDWCFRSYSISQSPDPTQISEKLFTNYTDAHQFLITQSNLASLIEERALKNKPDIVLLVVVDGLSFYDVLEWDQVEPCFVDGPSITEFGYINVRGDPPISNRLFKMGYVTQQGYTYYNPDGDNLSYHFFDRFSSNRIEKVAEFSDILSHLASIKIRKGYIQIAAAGLDNLCHHHPGRPPIKAYIDQIKDFFQQIIHHFIEKGRSVLACLTSDHGILWKDYVPKDCKIVGSQFSGEIGSPRYLIGSLNRHFSKALITADGKAYSLLKFDYMIRQVRSNEWGVHGGLSAWESIVPLLLKYYSPRGKK